MPGQAARINLGEQPARKAGELANKKPGQERLPMRGGAGIDSPRDDKAWIHDSWMSKGGFIELTEASPA